MDRRRKYVIVMTIAITMTRVGMGYQMAILGQNLLYFTKNVNVSVATLSFSFMAGSLGMVFGGFLTPCVKKKYPRRQFYFMAIAEMVTGILASATPWIRAFWLFFTGYVLGGIAFGVLETGLTALILELLNEKESRFHIQLYHLNYGIGAFIGPLIAGALIQSGDDGLHHETKRCQPNISHHISHVSASLNLSEHYSTDTDISDVNITSIDGNAMSYHLLTLWVIFPAAMMIYLAVKNMERKFMEKRYINGHIGRTNRDNTDEPLKSVIWILVAVTGYYFSIVATDCVVHYFLYSVAVCSKMSFTMINAVLLNSLTWLGQGVGRLIATVVAKRIRPLFIILFGIVVSSSSCIIMSIFGESHPWVSWGWACVFGFSTSILYPAGISWLSRKVCVTGMYMFVFTLGGALGGFAALPLAGAVFDRNVFSVMHLITGLCLLTGIFFMLSMISVRGRKDWRDEGALEEKLEANENDDMGTGILLQQPSLKNDA